MLERYRSQTKRANLNQYPRFLKGVTVKKITSRITGTSLLKERFRVHETDKFIDVASVFEVLKGNLVAYRIRRFLPPDACAQIVNNFWKSPERVARFGRGEDGVEGYFIGASHIEKTTREYLQEVRASENAVKSLYTGTINPVSAFIEALVSAKIPNLNVRSAKLNELSAGDSKAVYWNNLGEFFLEPHDDFAQLKAPNQKDFEIQQTTRIMAVNFYAEVPMNSGHLKFWNIEPDDEARANLGLTYSGFPYPAELLDEFQSIIIPVETGDLCVVNGHLVHAVLRGNSMVLSKNRLLITCFMGLVDNNELIRWT